MSDNPITNVLNILRLIKHNNMPNNSTVDNVKKWCPQEIVDSAVLRVFSYVLDQCHMARELIVHSQLSTEAQDGLLQTLDALKNCFQLPTSNNAISSFLPQIDSAVSSFSILASVYADDQRVSENHDLQELIVEVEKVLALFLGNDGGPSRLNDLAVRHLYVLLTTLRNVDALGIDAAMAAYAELVVRLKTATKTANEAEKETATGVWPTLLKWGDRLNKISEAVTGGKNLLENGSNVAHTLIGIAG